MVLAKVRGAVVSTAKAQQLQGLKLLLLEQVAFPELTGTNQYVVALDAVGANVGELVFYVTGSSARMTDVSKGKPTDATVAAIVDIAAQEDHIVYQKHTAGDAQ